MDLIYTSSKRVDMGVLSAYEFDLSFGSDENDFEIILNADADELEYGAFVYIEDTEYGGIVDVKKANSNGNTITYGGRTWHGMMNSKVIQPDKGQNYYSISGDANSALAVLIARLGLAGLFVAAEKESGINISKYQFKRYCKGYDGIRDMLLSADAKLKIEWVNRSVVLSAVPIVDYTEDIIDGDVATLSVEAHENKVNHLICLGKGELAEREVVHLYLDNRGNIGHIQCFTGLNENIDIYENSNTENLENDGINRFKELLNCDKAEISLSEDGQRIYDIGDIVGASEVKTGINVSASVSKKIVKIKNGGINIQYKTGG